MRLTIFFDFLDEEAHCHHEAESSHHEISYREKLVASPEKIRSAEDEILIDVELTDCVS